ncbi:hypothetical protein M1M92_05140 [Peptococcaceae bacterium]|nr:hypothetical protein [Peptococcaceae bacterium]
MPRVLTLLGEAPSPETLSREEQARYFLTKELLNWYKKVIALRHKYDVLKTGQWISLNVQEDVYGYVRIIENNRDIFNKIKENQDIEILPEFNDILTL